MGGEGAKPGARIIPRDQGSSASSSITSLLGPSDNLHHNYLHLNVNSPKHHAATLGMQRPAAARGAGPSCPAVGGPSQMAGGAQVKPCELCSQCACLADLGSLEDTRSHLPRPRVGEVTWSAPPAWSQHSGGTDKCPLFPCWDTPSSPATNLLWSGRCKEILKFWGFDSWSPDFLTPWKLGGPGSVGLREEGWSLDPWV